MAVTPDDARVSRDGGLAAGRGDARPSPREDARLVEALRAGEPDAFAELVKEYQGVVFNLALRLVRDREDARDITQDVLIKAYGAIPATDGELRLRPWLYRVTANTCWDHLRAARRRPRPSEDAEALASARPADDGERAEVARLFSESLAALPPRQQAALLLKDVHGLGHADIAETLGITRGSSKVLLFHARHSFRRAYRSLIAEDTLPEVCRVAERAAAASVGGRLTAAQRRAVLRHARTCADCHKVVERWQGPQAVGLALALPLVAAPQLFGAAGAPAAAGPGLLGAGASLGAGAATAAASAAMSGAGAATGAVTSAGAAAGASSAASGGAAAAAGAGAAASAAGAGASSAALGAAGGVAAKLAGLGVAKAAAVVIAAASIAVSTGAEAPAGGAERPPHRGAVPSSAVRPGPETPVADASSRSATATTAPASQEYAGQKPLRPEKLARVPAWLERRGERARATAAAWIWVACRHGAGPAGWSVRPRRDRPARAAGRRAEQGRRAAARTRAYAAATARRDAALLRPQLDDGAVRAGVARADRGHMVPDSGWKPPRSVVATGHALLKQGRPASIAAAQGRPLRAAPDPTGRPAASASPPRVRAVASTSSPGPTAGERASRTHASAPPRAGSQRAVGTKVRLGAPPRDKPDRPVRSPEPEGVPGA